MNLLAKFASFRLPFRLQDEDDRASPRRLAVSGNGRWIAVVSKDNLVRVWNADSGRLLCALEIDCPGASVAISANGGLLMAGTIGSRRDASEPVKSHIFAWSLFGGKPRPLWKTQQIGPGTGIVLEPRGKWCAVASVYGRLHIFDMATGQLRRAVCEVGNGFSDTAVSPDGRTVVTVGQHLKFWEPLAVPLPAKSLPIDAEVTEETSRRFIRARHGTWGNAVAMAPDGKWAAIMCALESPTGHASTLAGFDVSNGRATRVLARELSNVNCLALSPNGDRIAVGFDAPKVEIRAVDNPTAVQTWDMGDFGRVRSLAFLNEGKRLAVVNQQGIRAEIRTVADGRRVRELLSDR